jgi:DNA polymerase-4
MSRYVEVSRNIMALLKEYTPEFHQISIDEAYLDLSGTERLLGPPPEVAKRIKEEIKEAEGLTLSVGIAPNSYLAKLASEAGKPDGLLLIEEGEELAFLDSLELHDLWGVGEKTLTLLRELNITSIPRLRAFSRDILDSMLGQGAAGFLFRASRGMDPGIYPTRPKSHSMSSEVTFERDRRDLQSIKQVLLELSQQVMSRIIQENQRSKTVVIKVRYHDFTTTNAQKTLRHWLTSSTEIYEITLELLRKRWDGHTPIRLIGVGVSGVESLEKSSQLELFPDSDDRKKRLEEAVIGIKKKHAGVKLTRASLLKLKNIRSGPEASDPKKVPESPDLRNE